MLDGDVTGVQTGGLAIYALSVKSGGGVTTSVTVAVCVRLPLTPVIVTVEVPSGVLGLGVTERVDDPVAGFGVKLPVAPLGSPLTLSVTWPVKPPVGLTVTS